MIFTFVRSPLLSHNAPVRKFAFNYPLLLLVMWTGLLLAGDYVVLDTSVRQLRSRGFTSTTGKIVQSAVAKGAMGHRGVDIQYNYTVNGVDFTGHRYRYDDRNAAFEYAAATNAFPPWAERTVYYNPANPEDSLLDPGLHGSDLLLLLFALPISLLTAALWWRSSRPSGTAPGWPRPGRPDSARPRRNVRDWLSFRRWRPAVWAWPRRPLSAFSPSFPSAARPQPDGLPISVVWSLVWATGASRCIWVANRHQRRNYDLRINPSAQTVTLPRTGGRTAPLTVPRREILSVSMLRRVSISPSGSDSTFTCPPSSAPRPTPKRSR